MGDTNNYLASCNLISKMFAQRIWRNFSALGMIKDLAITLERRIFAFAKYCIK